MENRDTLYLTKGHEYCDCVFDNLCSLLCETYDNHVIHTIDGFIPECKM